MNTFTIQFKRIALTFIACIEDDRPERFPLPALFISHSGMGYIQTVKPSLQIHNMSSIEIGIVIWKLLLSFELVFPRISPPLRSKGGLRGGVSVVEKPLHPNCKCRIHEDTAIEFIHEDTDCEYVRELFKEDSSCKP